MDTITSALQKKREMRQEREEKERAVTAEIINVLRKHEIPIYKVKPLFEHVYDNIMQNTVP